MIESKSTKQWIFDNVLPRPRDLIHFLLRSIEFAINRGHSKILKEDLLSALKNHSSFALNQIIAEYQAEESWLPIVLHSFMGTYTQWTYMELAQHIDALDRSVLKGKTIGEVIASLVAVHFIGIKLSENEIRYASDIQESRTLTGKVKNHPKVEPLDLVIHPVFKHHLGLNETRGKKDKNDSLLNKVKSLLYSR
jgi:hypothetical protein